MLNIIAPLILVTSWSLFADSLFTKDGEHEDPKNCQIIFDSDRLKNIDPALAFESDYLSKFKFEKSVRIKNQWIGSSSYAVEKYRFGSWEIELKQKYLSRNYKWRALSELLQISIRVDGLVAGTERAFLAQMLVESVFRDSPVGFDFSGIKGDSHLGWNSYIRVNRFRYQNTFNIEILNALKSFTNLIEKNEDILNLSWRPLTAFSSAYVQAGNVAALVQNTGDAIYVSLADGFVNGISRPDLNIGTPYDKKNEFLQKLVKRLQLDNMLAEEMDSYSIRILHRHGWRDIHLVLQMIVRGFIVDLPYLGNPKVVAVK